MLLRQKTSKDSHETWFGVDGVASSMVDEAVTRTGTRTSNVFEL